MKMAECVYCHKKGNFKNYDLEDQDGAIVEAPVCPDCAFSYGLVEDEERSKERAFRIGQIITDLQEKNPQPKGDGE